MSCVDVCCASKFRIRWPLAGFAQPASSLQHEGILDLAAELAPDTLGLQEVLDRFGSGSAQREAQAQSLQWLVPICRRAGIAKLLINGSFVTDRLEPNDVDCVLLQGPAYRTDSDAAAELRQGLPFLEIKIVTQADYQFFAETVFGTARDGTPKGVIEVEL